MADGAPAHDDHGRALAVAARLHATGDDAGALELLPDLVAARPDDGAVRLLLARCLATSGTPAVALAAADAAAACDPTSWEAQVVLAQAAAAIDPERAAHAAERAVQLAPDQPDAHRAQAAVQAARVEQAAPEDGVRRRGTGGFGAALGLRTTTSAAPVTPPSEEPRLTPRLPAALAGVVPGGPPEDGTPTVGEPTPAPAPPPAPPAAAPPPATRPEAPRPRALGGTGLAPAPTQADPAAGRPDPPLPRALGGTGLAGSVEEGATPAADRVGAARLVVRVLGLAVWVLFGFRVGVQGIGGPVGIVVFVAVLGVVIALGRQLTRR